MIPSDDGSEPTDIRREAKRLLAERCSAATFSGRFFGFGGPMNGHPLESPQEREKRVNSNLYRWLQSRLHELREREAKAFEREVELGGRSIQGVRTGGRRG